mgnify:CR=1 FL=1
MASGPTHGAHFTRVRVCVGGGGAGSRRPSGLVSGGASGWGSSAGPTAAGPAPRPQPLRVATTGTESASRTALHRPSHLDEVARDLLLLAEGAAAEGMWRCRRLHLRHRQQRTNFSGWNCTSMSPPQNQPSQQPARSCASGLERFYLKKTLGADTLLAAQRRVKHWVVKEANRALLQLRK